MELLTVLVVIGIIAGLGVTAMNHIGRAQALQNGARQFANDLNLARNFALVNNSKVCLLVATYETTNSLDYAYISYAFVTNALSMSYDEMKLATHLTNVTYIEDVKYLPRGVVFQSNAPPAVMTKQVNFPREESSARPVWCVIFTGDGQIQPFKDRPAFNIVEGFVDPNNFKTIATGSVTNGYKIEINPLIGKPSVIKLP